MSKQHSTLIAEAREKIRVSLIHAPDEITDVKQALLIGMMQGLEFMENPARDGVIRRLMMGIPPYINRSEADARVKRCLAGESWQEVYGKINGGKLFRKDVDARLEMIAGQILSRNQDDSA